MRIRTIKPETFISDDIAALSFAARWTFIGLLAYVDDAGRGRNDPRLVKAAIFPLDDAVTASDVADWVKELENRGLVHAYKTGEIALLHVVNFTKHQKINRPTKSRLPACVVSHDTMTSQHDTMLDICHDIPSTNVDDTVDIDDNHDDTQENRRSDPYQLTLTDDSLNPQGGLTVRSYGTRIKGTGEQGKEIKPFRSSAAPPTTTDIDFDRFWDVYPRHTHKAAAAKAWAKARKSGTPPETMIDGANRYAESRRGQDPQFTAIASTWINGLRWDDEPAVITGRAGAEHVPSWEA